MYQKMGLVQKIEDEVCVLAVAGLWGRIEGAPLLWETYSPPDIGGIRTFWTKNKKRRRQQCREHADSSPLSTTMEDYKMIL